MNVRLISVTKPDIHIDKPIHEYGEFRGMTAEELLVYIARVSNPSNQANVETAPKLIKYLIDHKHWSPFDMVNLCVEVKTSKAIGIQILRHWSIKPQEFSQRYAEATEVEDIEFRYQAEKNRQSSDIPIGTVGHMTHGSTPSLLEFNKVNFFTAFNGGGGELDKWLLKVAGNLGETMKLYEEGIKLGVAKECARMILPLATSTTLYLNGSVRSWIHYLEQRLSPHAQKEHREVAREIEKIFKEQFPNVAEALGL